MPLKDRLKSKQTENSAELTEETKLQTETVEFRIPTSKLTRKILGVKNDANLGSIVKEISRFFETLADDDTEIVLRGNFDIGKKALISCLLSNISGNILTESSSTGEYNSLKKRRSLKEKIRSAKAKALDDDELE